MKENAPALYLRLLLCLSESLPHQPPEVTLNKMSFLSCLSAIIVPNAVPIHKFPVQYLAAGYCPPLSKSQSFVGGKRF